MKDEIQSDEKLLGEWTINYVPPQKGRYLGTLLVTDQRLLFDAQFDMSMKGILKETLFIIKGSHGYLEIPKNMIQDVRTEKSLFKKKVILEVEGEEHQFDYGILSVSKLFKAIAN
jgi:hypothetical protein